MRKAIKNVCEFRHENFFERFSTIKVLALIGVRSVCERLFSSFEWTKSEMSLDERNTICYQLISKYVCLTIYIVSKSTLLVVRSSATRIETIYLSFEAKKPFHCLTYALKQLV